MRFFNVCWAIVLTTSLHISQCTPQLNAKIFQSNSKLSLEIQNVNNPELLIVGLNNKNFTKLTKQEDIRIICGKQGGIVAGRLGAFVNTNQAKSMKCLKYHPEHKEDIVYCLKQEFRFTLPTRGYSYYDIFCRFVDTQDLSSISTLLHRLYDDDIPRIRSGNYLDNIKGTVQHTINLEKISCEAIKSNSKSSFNALQWFTTTNKSIGFNTVSNQITENLFLYSSEFPASSMHVRDNSIYKCCTILNGAIQHCQQFLASIYKTTTFKPITSTIITATTALTSSTTTLGTESSQKALVFLPKLVEKEKENLPVSTSTVKVSSEVLKSKSTTSEAGTSLKETAQKVENIQKGYIDSTIIAKDSNELADNEIGIIIGCTGGIVILALLIILFLLCYKRHRYGRADQHNIMQKKHVKHTDLPVRSIEGAYDNSTSPFSGIATARLEDELEANRNKCPFANKQQPSPPPPPELKEELNANRNQCPFANQPKQPESMAQLEQELESNRSQCPFATKTKHIEETSEINELIHHAYPDKDIKKLTSFRNSSVTEETSQMYLQARKSSKTSSSSSKQSSSHSEVKTSTPPPPPPMPAPQLNSNLTVVNVVKQSSDSESFPPPPPPIFGLNQLNKINNDDAESKSNEQKSIYY